MAGYSGTPLPKKLGLKSGQRVRLVGAPGDFRVTLGEIRGAIDFDGSPPYDLMIFFAHDEGALRREFTPCAASLTTAGMLWVAWPKRTSGVPTDLTEDRVRAVGLAAGLVDVKVCAIDEVWSGLKFVVRLADRADQRRTQPQ